MNELHLLASKKIKANQKEKKSQCPWTLDLKYFAFVFQSPEYIISLPTSFQVQKFNKK